MEEVGLVLEGGGMRGLYTAGVLEYLMEQNLYFPYVIGVSAGACMAASYLSRQKGRNKKVNIDLVSDPRFLSFRNFISKRELFGMDFLFDEIPRNIVPFDFNTFQQGSEQFVVVTTDCETGEAQYFRKHDHGDHMLKIMRASSSLPFISRSVEYDGSFHLDGGIADPIPLKKAQQDGNKKNIIILTGSVQRKLKRRKVNSIIKYLYTRHPKIAYLMQERYRIYNNALAYIELEKMKGNLFIIQPSSEVPTSRVERNQGKLTQLYELGYQDAAQQINQLNKFIKTEKKMTVSTSS